MASNVATKGWERGFLLRLCGAAMVVCMTISLLACAQPPDARQGQPQPAPTGEPASPELGDMTVSFIDVGQGDSELVELPDGKVMLIDAGEASASASVLEALDEANVGRIDYLVASHPHADHIGGMEAVLGAYDVGEVWAPDAPDATETYEGFLDAVDEKGLGIDRAEAGESIVDEAAGYSVSLLGPAKGVESDDMNDYSAIVKVSYGDTSFLFTGDATAKEVVDAAPGHVDMLKAAHHGSETGTDDEVMAATTPEYVVMSYAEGNSYGHPDQSVLDAVSAAGATALSTAANGDVTCTSDGQGVTVTTQRSGTVLAGVSAGERARQGAGTSAEAEVQGQAEAQSDGEARAQAGSEERAEPGAGTQAQRDKETVVVTPNGEKYHRRGCPTLSDSKELIEMTRSQAEEQGREACKVCKP